MDDQKIVVWKKEKTFRNRVLPYKQDSFHLTWNENGLLALENGFVRVNRLEKEGKLLNAEAQMI